MKESTEYQAVESVDSFELEHTSEDESLLAEGVRRKTRQRSRCSQVLIALLLASGLALYTFLISFGTWKVTVDRRWAQRRHGTRFLSSPANDFITYEPRVMEQWEDPNAPQYFGEPSEKIDEAWYNIFKYQNIGIKPELMHRMGREDEGILLPDGTYFGSLMVFHHLHCLKNLQHALHPDYYELDVLTGNEKAMFWEHTNHCLHMLMDAVMCQGDTTVLTMKWSPTSARPIGNLTSPHECINWDRLMEWVEPNSVDVFTDGALVHPTFGPLFKNGDPSSAFRDSLKSTGVGKVHGLDPDLTAPHEHKKRAQHQYAGIPPS